MQADQNALSAAAARVTSIKHPFDTIDDDHCESPIEAYRDISGVLKQLAKKLGKTESSLQIYDPFYCAGAVEKHFDSLGFKNVYNRCEDFYEKQKLGQIPAHDVVITNPPYSGDHPEKLLQWCRANRKPFCLLMPNYFINKSYFIDALASHATILFLVPKKRYNYWTPKGLRGSRSVQSQHTGAGGYRTSPFISFWYIDLSPIISSQQLLKWWNKNCRRKVSTRLYHQFELPKGVLP